MNDIDLCSGLFCPLKNTCWRYLHRPKSELLWLVDPAYSEKEKKCKLYLKKKKS